MCSLGAAIPVEAVRSRGAGATAGGALLVSGLTSGGTLVSAGGGTSAAAVRLGPCAGGLGIARASVAAATGAGGGVATPACDEVAVSGEDSSAAPPTSEDAAAGVVTRQHSEREYRARQHPDSDEDCKYAARFNFETHAAPYIRSGALTPSNSRHPAITSLSTAARKSRARLSSRFSPIIRLLGLL